MVTIDQNNYYKILAETISLFKEHKSLMIDNKSFAKTIDKSIGITEDMRSEGMGPKYVKFGDVSNSPVRYRIDHIAAFKLKMHYSPSENESKELLKKVLASGNNIKQYSLKETAALFSFSTQKLKKDIEKLNKEENRKVNLFAPRYVRLGVKPKSIYQFNRDEIIEHICGLKYIKTVSW
ncbi:MAG: hypothetical protein PHZ17_01620 [Sulfurovum sp.]|nr:hypothetical protein [Sulfurovum sp.]